MKIKKTSRGPFWPQKKRVWSKNPIFRASQPFISPPSFAEPKQVLLHPTSGLNTYIPDVLGYWERTWGLFLGGGVGLGTWPLSHKNLLGRSGLGVSGGFRGEGVELRGSFGDMAFQMWNLTKPHGLPKRSALKQRAQAKPTPVDSPIIKPPCSSPVFISQLSKPEYVVVVVIIIIIIIIIIQFLKLQKSLVFSHNIQRCFLVKLSKAGTWWHPPPQQIFLLHICCCGGKQAQFWKNKNDTLQIDKSAENFIIFKKWRQMAYYMCNNFLFLLNLIWQVPKQPKFLQLCVFLLLYNKRLERIVNWFLTKDTTVARWEIGDTKLCSPHGWWGAKKNTKTPNSQGSTSDISIFLGGRMHQVSLEFVPKRSREINPETTKKTTNLVHWYPKGAGKITPLDPKLSWQTEISKGEASDVQLTLTGAVCNTYKSCKSMANWSIYLYV